MDASTLTRNLQPMVANGWAEVGPGADGRSRLVTSPRGAGQAGRGAARMEAAQLALNARLG